MVVTTKTQKKKTKKRIAATKMQESIENDRKERQYDDREFSASRIRWSRYLLYHLLFK
uniref:Thioredoxin-related family protein n=1 Tax=Rhizophora mucronata TaxID=61149 RepID=A0A2P2K341_RHIMU